MARRAPAPAANELLWSFPGVARLYAWALVGVSLALVAVAVALEATSEDGLSWRYAGVLTGVAGLSGLVFFPVLRVWLGRGGLPSARLPDATRATGPRRLEATRADWRRWALATVVVLLVAGVALMMFLIAVLGRGGTAEGVVVGVLLAWGLVTLEDARRVEAAERAEGRRYYAACRRPTGVGNRLVWTAGPSAGGGEAGAG